MLKIEYHKNVQKNILKLLKDMKDYLLLNLNEMIQLKIDTKELKRDTKKEKKEHEKDAIKDDQSTFTKDITCKLSQSIIKFISPINKSH